jgi:hypothetical protein
MSRPHSSGRRRCKTRSDHLAAARHLDDIYRQALARDRRWASGSAVVRQSEVGPGSVILATVPFADGTGEKPRPVVVLELSDAGVLVVPCSAQEKGKRSGYTPISDRHVAGLLRATYVSRRTIHLAWDRLLVSLGQCSKLDWRRIRANAHGIRA